MERRKQRKARNLQVLEMITTRKGGPHRDRRDRRVNNPKNIDWS
jgi:hypothetical protein